MRDEGRRWAVQVMKVGEKDFVLRRGEFIGEDEQVTSSDDEGAVLRLSEVEGVFSEEAAVPTGSLVEKSDLEESCDDAHVQVVIDNLLPELNSDQQTADERCIRDPGMFSKSDYDTGRTNIVQQVMDTGLHRPFKQQLRHHPLAHLEIIDKHVSVILQNDVIEPPAFLWASNVVLVRKANRELRFCVDYRQLNLHTYNDSYPLPRIETCLDSLRGSKFFSSLDLRSEYWQAAIDPASADKTAFVTRERTLRVKVFSFELTNAPALFQS